MEYVLRRISLNQENLRKENSKTLEDLKIIGGTFHADLKSSDFYIMTEERNYIYSDPKFGGDNTLKKTDILLKDWKQHKKTKCIGSFMIGEYIDEHFKYVK